MQISFWNTLGALLVALTLPIMMVVGVLANEIFHLV
jgi:hypothetical protein